MPDRMAGLVVGSPKLVASKPTETATDLSQRVRTAVLVWVVAAVCYFFTWILHHVSGGAGQIESAHYQTAFATLLLGVGCAIVLTLCLQETGSAARRSFSETGEET